MAIATKPAKKQGAVWRKRAAVKGKALRPTSPGMAHKRTVQFDYVSPKRGRAILDREARRYLNMSGAEFRVAYREGRIEDPDRSEVVRVAMLLPFADD